MLSPTEVPVQSVPFDRFAPSTPAPVWQEAMAAFEDARGRMAGRTWWNVNSTARGGGVAEMLTSLLGYARGLGVDARWVVIEGTQDFFRITKRLHHALHGSAGDGSPLGPSARAVYDEVLRDNLEELGELVRPHDVVLLHDPQTAGLAPALARLGAHVAWRCHVGSDTFNAQVERAWDFLEPYLVHARVCIFTRAKYVPAALACRASIVRPSIDVFSVKNQDMDAPTACAVLARCGLLAASAGGDAAPAYRRSDGVASRVNRGVDVLRHGPAPSPETPLVVQVSRWDPLKDPAGVMAGFERMLHQAPQLEAHLVLAGPSVTSVADDPEATRTFEDVMARWWRLPDAARARIHLACLPMVDVEENAAIVNALQRHGTVLVQKSLQEGFGLTVTEAMWKGRPVVASAVGGILDQLVDGEHGLLLSDPTDLDAFAAAVRRLLEEPPLADRLGRAGHARVLAEFTGLRHLRDFARLIDRVDAPPSEVAPVAAGVGI